MKTNSLKPFVGGKIIILGEDATVGQAAAAMLQSQSGSVLLTDHRGHLTGIVTDRDIACAFASEDVHRNTQLGFLSSGQLHSLCPHQTLKEAINLMYEQEVRRVPIIEKVHGQKQKCVGMVTMDDLIAGKFASSRALSRIVRSQISQLGYQFAKRSNFVTALGRYATALFWPYWLMD